MFIIGSVLTISTLPDDGWFDNVPIIISALDDDGATGKDTLIVSIRSWPPVFEELDPIAVLSDSGETVELNSLITDADTELSIHNWTFQLVDYFTGKQDGSATLTYDHDNQLLTIDALDTNYTALDLLYLRVVDDNSNWAVDTVAVGFFADLNPMFIPFTRDTILTSSTDTLLTLTDYIIDPIDVPADIAWPPPTGGDSLASVIIDQITKKLIVSTNDIFFGPDTIAITATNSEGYTAAQDLIVHVVPASDGPARWSPMPTYETVYGWVDTLFDIRQMVKDDFTVDEDLLLTMTVESDPNFIATFDTTTYLVTVESLTPELRKVWIVFDALDKGGFMSESDTLWVEVKDSYSPVWSPIDSYLFYAGETVTDTLSKYVSDKDTPDSNLTILPIRGAGGGALTVTYDSATYVLTITSGPIASRSNLTIYATDDKGNTTSQIVLVTVLVVQRDDPPEGNLTYHFNTIADRWINYVVVTDSHAVEMNVSYTYNNQLDTKLKFFQEDSLPGVQRWSAPKEFRAPGTYILKVDVLDGFQNVLEMGQRLSVALSKRHGDKFYSPDEQISVSYGAGIVGNGQLVIVSEDVAQPGIQNKFVALAKGGGENTLPPTLYAIDANTPDEFTIDLAHNDDNLDDYHSFYRLEGANLVPLTTFKVKSGHFIAKSTTGTDILFGPSDVLAEAAPLPKAYILAAPNPFNPTVKLTVSLPEQDTGQLRIFNLLGKEVYSTTKQLYSAGTYTFTWSGIGKHGQPLSSGIYFVRLETGQGPVALKKVTLLK